MSRWLLLRCALAVTLLSVGLAARANATQPAAGTAQPESIASLVGHGLDASLPVHFTALAAPVLEVGTRGSRSSSESSSATRQRAEEQHASRRASGAAWNRGQNSCDAAARLLRCGIDSSALGTPPPQS